MVTRGQMSDWSLVKSGVPQGSVLEALFFFSKVATREEINRLQDDLNKLYH